MRRSRRTLEIQRRIWIASKTHAWWNQRILRIFDEWLPCKRGRKYWECCWRNISTLNCQLWSWKWARNSRSPVRFLVRGLNWRIKNWKYEWTFEWKSSWGWSENFASLVRMTRDQNKIRFWCVKRYRIERAKCCWRKSNRNSYPKSRKLRNKLLLKTHFSFTSS